MSRDGAYVSVKISCCVTYVEEYLDVRLCNGKTFASFYTGSRRARFDLLCREMPDMGIESSQLISAPAKNIYNCYKMEKKKIRHHKLELSGKSVDHLTLET